MRLARTFLFLILLLAGCSRPDAQLSHEIVGVWLHELPGTPVLLTIGSDGGFASNMWYPNLHPNLTNTWSGTWEVSNGVFITTSTKSNGVPIHFVSRCRIVQLDRHVLTCEIDYLNNGTISYHR